MCLDLGFMYDFAKERQADLWREADNERLANLVIGPGRPVRAQIADWLLVIAERVEGRPRGSIVRAEA
jgi:hypothetical protein